MSVTVRLKCCIITPALQPELHHNSDMALSTTLCLEPTGITLAVIHPHRAASKAATSDKRRGIPSTFIHSKGVNSRVKGLIGQLSLCVHCSHVLSNDTSTTMHPAWKNQHLQPGCPWGSNTTMLSAHQHAPHYSRAVRVLHSRVEQCTSSHTHTAVPVYLLIIIIVNLSWNWQGVLLKK